MAEIYLYTITWWVIVIMLALILTYYTLLFENNELIEKKDFLVYAM